MNNLLILLAAADKAAEDAVKLQQEAFDIANLAKRQDVCII